MKKAVKYICNTSPFYIYLKNIIAHIAKPN